MRSSGLQPGLSRIFESQSVTWTRRCESNWEKKANFGQFCKAFPARNAAHTTSPTIGQLPGSQVPINKDEARRALPRFCGNEIFGPGGVGVGKIFLALGSGGGM